MHVRVCGLRQAPVAIRREAAEPVCEVPIEGFAKHRGPQVPTRRGPERAVSARKGEQRKSLVIEFEARLATTAIEIDNRHDRAVWGVEMRLKIVERVLGSLAPRTIPAEPAHFAIGKGLAGDGAGAVRPRDGRAVEIDSLVETTAGSIGAHFPPQWQGPFE